MAIGILIGLGIAVLFIIGIFLDFIKGINW